MNNDYYKNNDEQSMSESHFDAVMKKYQSVRMNPEEKREVFKQTMLVIEKIEAVSLAHGDLNKAMRPTSAFVEDESLLSFGAASGRAARSQKGVKGIASAWISYIQQRQFVPALLTAAVFLFTGGASVLAERALPGDSLYPFKVNVNESIRELAAVSTEAKAKLAVEATERRLQEAALLSAEGRLDESNKKIIQDQFSKNATQVRNQVASLFASNDELAAAEISENFEITLGAHSKILDTLAGNGQAAAPSDALALGQASSSAPVATSSDAASAPAIAAAKSAAGIATLPITASSISASAASAGPVDSLLLAVQAEIDTTKTARIGLEAQANATIAKSSDQASTTTKAVIDSMAQGIRFTMSDIATEIDAHKFDPKAFSYAADTVEFARKRLENASSSIEEMISLSKEGSYAEAVKKGRATSRMLSEVLVVLKIEKTTKGSLDGKVNVTSLVRDDMDAASTTPEADTDAI